MEVGVPGETTASVHVPVAQEFHSRRDSVIIPGMSDIYTLEGNVYKCLMNYFSIRIMSFVTIVQRY